MLRRTLVRATGAADINDYIAGNRPGVKGTGVTNRKNREYLRYNGNNVEYSGASYRAGTTLGSGPRSPGRDAAEGSITNQDKLWAEENKKREKEFLESLSWYERMKVRVMQLMNSDVNVIEHGLRDCRSVLTPKPEDWQGKTDQERYDEYMEQEDGWRKKYTSNKEEFVRDSSK
eukprot:Rhum_TRINITY_DN17178_c0_g1::Rhum_TRINITY_DN17178_c0_g1_i1::g.165440::m.165440